MFVSDEYDFALIVNDFTCTVSIPGFMKVLKRKNSTDIEAWGEGIVFFNARQYKNVIFINSACIGPFLPSYETRKWPQIFTDLLEENDLVGPIIECPDDKGDQTYDWSVGMPFVHSYMFALSNKALQVLVDLNVFTDCSKDEAIVQRERMITSLILKFQLKVKCLLKRESNIDWTKPRNWGKRSTPSCPEVPGNYDGLDIHPLEIIFVKNIRNPHKHRCKEHSGISKSLQTQIQNYTRYE
jgi:hypothetical protein